jgi:hypothetical protein
MHHVMISPLLQALMVVLLVGPAIQIVRVTGWRGRLALLTVVLLGALANPGRTRHVRGIERAAPQADAAQIRELVEYHDFVVLSAASIQGRLASVGLFDRLFVGSISCANFSRICVRSPSAPARVEPSP